ncbi:family 16 glycosylhydrolase [Rothia sp. (in: high G+C Gram-positive bacteria)]|uniref:glycoside hydrolase family 16 protein n=1 Tax=Rothia sp. (in: high G+C Gram-positive bacteria) TaxID=1885016 RepID=UPI0032179D2C
MKSSVLALKPVYVDTFRNGINTNVWNVWGAKHDDYVTYDRGVIRGTQVSVRNNELVVAMSKRSSPRTFSGDPVTQRWWDTGWISTKPAYGITYGAYEVEAMLPTAPHISAGVWSGIWSRPFAAGIGGEIDPAEAFGHEGAETRHSRAEGFTSTVHFTQNRRLSRTADYRHSSKLSPATEKPLSTTFHTYGMFKSDQEIIIYLDRKEIHRITRADRPKAWGAAYPARTPFDLRICLQAGGNWGGYPTSRTALRSEIRVRKVTLWNFETTPLTGVAYRG